MLKYRMVQIVFTLIGIIVAGIPTWLYIAAKVAFSPQGFWQNLALAGVGVFFLGFLQLGLIVLLCGWLHAVWS